MRLDINTLKSEFTEEEWKMIKEYIKWVKKELKYPSKPEIVIGGARYPLGRMVVKRGLVKSFQTKVEKTLEGRPNKESKLNPLIDCLLNIQTIINKLKIRGKTVNSAKRKNDTNLS